MLKQLTRLGPTRLGPPTKKNSRISPMTKEMEEVTSKQKKNPEKGKSELFNTFHADLSTLTKISPSSFENIKREIEENPQKRAIFLKWTKIIHYHIKEKVENSETIAFIENIGKLELIVARITGISARDLRKIYRYSDEMDRFLDAVGYSKEEKAVDLNPAQLKPNFLLKGQNLSKLELNDLDLSGMSFEGSNLKETNLYMTNLSGTQLQMAHLEGANLYMANLSGTQLQMAHLEGANLYMADLEKADLRGAFLQGAKLKRASLKGALLDENASIEFMLPSDDEHLNIFFNHSTNSQRSALTTIYSIDNKIIKIRIMEDLVSQIKKISTEEEKEKIFRFSEFILEILNDPVYQESKPITEFATALSVLSIKKQ